AVPLLAARRIRVRSDRRRAARRLWRHRPGRRVDGRAAGAGRDGVVLRRRAARPADRQRRAVRRRRADRRPPHAPVRVAGAGHEPGERAERHRPGERPRAVRRRPGDRPVPGRRPPTGHGPGRRRPGRFGAGRHAGRPRGRAGGL
ncbi:MAG: Septum-associated rare lipoprotein A, partial [uncultured Phycisphaerae bacterium]